ncbi:MAG: TonB-dependent receptor [Opitutus sp.]|nr:TonB-dependent receptor [Opitutus sp.]
MGRISHFPRVVPPPALHPNPMNQRCSVALLLGWIFFALVPPRALVAAESGPAAARESGTITGRVLNAQTGQYLNNARVAIKGTGVLTFTDQTGAYRLVGVPGGSVTLEVFFTGLDPQQATLAVAAGRELEHDFQLGIGSVVKLDKFTVQAAADLETIATNEQRFASNLKLVAAPGENEFVVEGNVGEFMKSLPGISAEYSDVEIMGISVRGFGSNVVGLTLDGSNLAGANYTGSARSFQTPNLSMNNISRVEITNVPTPSTPADSLGGSVNLVTKSAFERNKAQLSYSVFLSANQHAMKLGKIPHSSDREIYKILPGYTFDYTLPVNKNFGLVLSLNSSNIYNTQTSVFQKTYNGAGTNTGSSFNRPFLQTATLVYGPQVTNRNGGSIKADWRTNPHGVLSFGLQATHYSNYFATYTWTPTVGAIGTPTVAGGVPLTFGPDFTNGATGQGNVSFGGGGTRHGVNSIGANTRYRYDDGRWRLDAGFSQSAARVAFRQTGDGHFSGLTISMMNPVRVNFTGVTPDGPTNIEAFDNANRPVDLSDVNNYRLTAAAGTPRNVKSDLKGGDINLRRSFDRLGFPAAVQIGVKQHVQENDKRFETVNWTYNGPNGNAATVPQSPAPFLNILANRQLETSGPGFIHNLPWPSSVKAWDAFLKNPNLFSKTAAQLVAEETARITNSEYIEETVSAAYFQTDLRLLKNRLSVVTGVRYEQTKDDGLGPLVDAGAAFQRLSSGAFARDAAGNRIRVPAAGAAGSMEELRLTRKERAYRATRTYDGYYPSLNLSYQVTDNFQIRLGYAQTYGRPDFSRIIPNATINEANLTELQYNDPSVVRGTITIRNTALKPWSADNYDLSLEYYTDGGGLATVGVFRKDLKDFFGNVVKLATAADLQELGFEPNYVGWTLSTQTNTDSARVDGLAINLKQSLARLGGWGRYFSIFANSNSLQLKGSREADFTSFIKSSANWGFNFTRERFDFMARWNYRGRQKGAAVAALGPDAFAYTGATTMLDLNADYRLKKHLAFFVSARNVFNLDRLRFAYGAATPEYAKQNFTREYGTQYTAGVKGTF